MAVVDSQPSVTMVCTENVKNMFSKRSQWNYEVPIDIQDQKFKDRGFIPASVLTNLTQYTIPHSRNRAIGMYLKATKTRLACPPLENTFFSLRCTQLELSDFITEKVLSKLSRERTGEKWKELYKSACEELGAEAISSFLKDMKTAMPVLDLSLSDKEKSVLAVSVVHARQTRGLDAFKYLMVFQVESRLPETNCLFFTSCLFHPRG